MKKNNKLVTILLASSLLLPGIAPLATGVTSVAAESAQTVAVGYDKEYVVPVMDQVVRHMPRENASPVTPEALAKRGENLKFVSVHDDKWFKVQYGEEQGYVLRGDVTSRENFDSENTGIHDLAVTKQSGMEDEYTVAVRTSLRTSNAERYRPLKVLSRDTKVKYLGTTDSNENWFKVELADKTVGYVNRADVTRKENMDSDEPAEDYATKSELDENQKLDVVIHSAIRTQPGSQYRVLSELDRGTVVTYKGTTLKDNNWFKVELQNGTFGYINRGHVTQVEEPEVLPLEIDSVSPINSKTIKVDFNRPVEDTTKAEIEVKKGAIKVNVADKAWNEDNTAVELELAGKLTKGEYTVSVAGLTEEALTDSVTVENEKVADVKITSENAVLNANKTKVTATYKVYNQYGEDITSGTPLNASAAGVNVDSGQDKLVANNGKVEIGVDKNAVKVGDKVIFTLVHIATGESTSATLTVSDTPKVSEVAITGVYNKDGKELTETSNLVRDDFYLVVEGTDQYGNASSASDLDELLITNANDSIVGLNTTFETIQIDGKDATALKLTSPLKAGKTTVMLISGSTGKSTKYEVVVNEAQRADTMTFQVPELVVAGEELFIPITVLDKAGNEITDLDVLTNDDRGIKIDAGTANIVKKDGVIGYNYTARNATKPDSAGYVSVMGMTSSNKTEVVNIKVEKAAVPTVIRGLHKDKSSVLTKNETISKGDLVVEDQYGRAMTDKTTELELAANDSAPTGYRIVVKDNKKNTVIANGGEAKYVYDSGSITLAHGTNGTEKVEFALEESTGSATDAWKLVAGSSQEIEFTVTDGTEYVDYEVEEIGKILDEVGAGKANDTTNYNQKLVVNGILKDGKKVKLSHTAYTVTAPDYLGYKDGAFDVNTTSGSGKEVSYVKEEKELTTEITVTIDATGKQFTQSVIVSKEKPEIVDFKVVAQGEGDAINTKAAFDKEKDLAKIDKSFFTKAAVHTEVDFLALDEYGVVTKSDDATSDDLVPAYKLVAKPEAAIAHRLDITGQNTAGLQIGKLEKGEEVVIEVNLNGMKKSFTIVGNENVHATVATAKENANLAFADATNTATDTAPHIKAPATDGEDVNYSYSVSDINQGEGGADLAAVVDSNLVKITRGTKDGSFKLTVTMTKGTATATKTFTVKVPTSGEVTVE